VIKVVHDDKVVFVTDQREVTAEELCDVLYSYNESHPESEIDYTYYPSEPIGGGLKLWDWLIIREPFIIKQAYGEDRVTVIPEGNVYQYSQQGVEL
jgi:hypothetical protein